MKRLILISGALLLTALAACKKDTKLLSGKDWVVGSWRLTLQGPDKNGDGQFNVDEKNPIDEGAVVTYQFVAGSLGYRIGPNHSYVDTLEWSLLNNDRTLKLRLDDNGIVSNRFFGISLDFTNETMLMTDTSVTPAYFRHYQREN